MAPGVGTQRPGCQAYQRGTSAGRLLLSSLATLDSERAVALWRQWPDPPASLGEPARKIKEEIDKQFAEQLLMQTGGRDAEDALALLKEQASRGLDYSLNVRLAAQLNQSGKKDEALRVVDHTIAAFQQQDPDPRSISSYFSFVRQLPGIDPERYLLAMSSFLPSLDRQQAGKPGGSITIGDQSLQLTTAEAALIDVCRGLMGRPELTMKTLGLIPGLNSKLDRVGGVDAILNPMDRTKGMTLNYSIGGAGGARILSSAAPSPSIDPYQSLRGQSIKNPDLVRQKLAEMAQTPEQIDVLMNLASRASYEEPDLASTALELASQMVERVEPLQKRTGILQNLMRIYRNCEGEVSADLLQKGLLLVHQMRVEEQENAAMNPRPGMPAGARAGSSPADQLEMALVAELAPDHFDGAMRYVRLMPDEMRLAALLRIVQSLSQSY